MDCFILQNNFKKTDMKRQLLKSVLLIAFICILETVKAQTWQSIVTGIPVSAATNNLTPGCYSILAVNNQTILSTTASGIYRSTDNGSSWLSTGARGSNGFKVVKNNRILALGLGGILGSAISKSDDGGISWTASTTGIDPNSSGNVSIEDISVSPNGTIYIASRQNGAVYASTDNGDTWVEKAKAISGALWSILAIDDTTIIVGASDGVFRSTNAGNTWTKVLNTGSGYVVTMKKNSLGTIYIGLAPGVVRKSIDNGATWTNTAISSSSSSVYDIEIDKDNNLYVCLFNAAIANYTSSETFISIMGWATNGLSNTRVVDLSIEESSTSRKFYACSDSSAAVGGNMYRLETTLGLDNLNQFNDISIYPNPAKTSIKVEAINFKEDRLVKIISTDGKLMGIQKKLESEINISNLKPGVYILELTDNAGSKKIEKFIKN